MNDLPATSGRAWIGLASTGLAALAACDGPAPSDAPPAGGSAYTYTPPPDTAALPEPATIEAGLEQLIGAVQALDPAWLYDAYADVVATMGDAGCPVSGDHNGQQQWSGDCTTDAGVQFLGYTLSTEQADFPHDDGRQVDHLLWLSGIQRVVSPDGTELGLTGDDLVLEVPAQGEAPRAWEARLVGEFWSTLPQHAGTWLEDGALVDLDLAYTRPDDGRTLAVHGSLRWSQGEVVAATLEQVGLAARDAMCGLEPTGQVRLRTAGGTWVELVHDGANADGYRSVDCDGCGRAYAIDAEGGRQDLGEVCADWGRLLDWEYTPW